MKQSEIILGGKYEAVVNDRLCVVRVDSIREDVNGRKYYEVTNLNTDRRTTFKSSTKFRRESQQTIVSEPLRTITYDKSLVHPPHLIVEARAGTGKTTTLVEGVRRLLGEAPRIVPSEQQQIVWDKIALSGNARTIAFCAFNKAIEIELSKRVPAGCTTSTFHGLGCSAVRMCFRGIGQPNKYRTADILFRLSGGKGLEALKRYKCVHRNFISIVSELVSLCKINLLAGKPAEIDELIDKHDIDTKDITDEVYAAVPIVLHEAKNVGQDNQIDFDDMVWLPVVLNLRLPKYDLLLVDEAQDLNRCQQELLKRAGKRLIFCGDPKQAIYGFAGADSESMKTLEGDLKSTKEGCEHVYLTVTRRCGRAIVSKANEVVPDFSAHESTGEGAVNVMKFGTYSSTVKGGDMVLCRVNAPLVKECFKFLREGKKAFIQGRDVGAGLLRTIEAMKAKDIPDLVDKINVWADMEVEKEQRKKTPDEKRQIRVQDKRDCILTFVQQCTTLEELAAKIDDIFSDRTKAGIRLSSIHKAKGLEADRVFFLQLLKARCPHPMAKTPWQYEQEKNLLYVAYTRAIRELIIVS